METVNPRAGFLCNYEVLAILRQQRDDRAKQIKKLAQQKAKRVAALKRKPYSVEEEDDEGDRIQPQDLHTVTFEVIKQLEDPRHPMLRQTSGSIANLLEELERFQLTKSERLQIVNVAPTKLVELVVIITDLEQRFRGSEDQERLLSIVKEHLSNEPSQRTSVGSSAIATAGLQGANLDSIMAAKSSRSRGSASRLATTNTIAGNEEQDAWEMEEDEATRAELMAEDELMDEGAGLGQTEDLGKEIDEA